MTRSAARGRIKDSHSLPPRFYCCVGKGVPNVFTQPGSQAAIQTFGLIPNLAGAIISSWIALSEATAPAKGDTKKAKGDIFGTSSGRPQPNGLPGPHGRCESAVPPESGTNSAPSGNQKSTCCQYLSSWRCRQSGANSSPPFFPVFPV